MSKSDDFGQLFFRRELTELRGRGNRVTIYLTLLIALTFTALGFAIGGLEQLRERMANPFTRWVDFTVDGKAERRFTEMTEFLNEPATKEAFQLDGYSNWNRYWLFMHDRRHDPVNQPVDTMTRWQKGRTIDLGDDLFNEILSPNGGNLTYLDDAAFDEGGLPVSYCGIIVTEDLLDKVGYLPGEFSEVRYLSAKVNADKDIVFLPIIAVVKSLPSRSEFLTSHHLDNILQGNGVYDRFLLTNARDSSRIRLIGPADQSEMAGTRIKAAFGEWGGEVLVQSQPMSIAPDRKFQTYVVILPPAVTVPIRRNALRELLGNGGFGPLAEIDCSDDADRIAKSMYRTFNFASLDKIRDFESAIDDRFGLKLPMEQVENRENFRLVARLTFILGSFLFLFGLTAVLLYLSNLMRNHVNSISPHLGTFKAMGLPDKNLLRTYIGISLRLLIESLAVGIAVALPLGWLIDRFALRVGFNLFSGWILLAVLLMVVALILVTRGQLQIVFAKTPGDLIYERKNTFA